MTARFTEYRLCDHVPFPFNKYPSLYILCEAVLRNFSKRSLSSNMRLGTAARVRPPEAQFQDEWYRAFKSLLGHGVAISSEWSIDKSGRIDFRIPDPSWGIELLRDGDRLNQHCDRFLDGGNYFGWIKDGWLKDWIILDCRHSDPREDPQKYGDYSTTPSTTYS
jgi:hypothetical protein